MNGKLMAIFMMAQMVPLDFQMEKLQEALSQHKILGTKETKQNLQSAIMLLMIGLENEGLSIGEVIEKASRDEGKLNLMDNIMGDNSN
jgi:hypothetical protein